VSALYQQLLQELQQFFQLAELLLLQPLLNTNQQRLLKLAQMLGMS
jgi:hypothetical protein